MARKLREFYPEVPFHVVQRGNNRQNCFFTEVDRARYMSFLSAALLRYQVKLHAFVLMTNHVHLLMTPTTKDGISKVMQNLGRDYVAYVNYNYRRSGTLWEGRFKACMLDSPDYVLMCQRYIELNPVRAGLVTHPVLFHWCSYHAHAEGIRMKTLTAHPVYLALGSSEGERQRRYRDLIETGVQDCDIALLRRCLHSNSPCSRMGAKDGVRVVL